MKDRKQKGRAVPSPEAATPFFARFLENQHADAEAQAGPSRMTLKYPSDRDEIDPYSTLHGHAADAR